MVLTSLGASWTTLAVVVIAGLVAYLAVIALTRLAGVRSLAKMSSFDFAATVAMGSTLSSTLIGSVPLAAGALGLALLFAVQWGIAWLRRRGTLHGLVDNQPVLLMAGGRPLEHNLRRVRMSREELWSQLRLHGVQRVGDVRAVVMETTGDVSVLTGGDEIDDVLLEGVRG
jgi:uncharacterized membrane protein YcaP (DUF421 family)